MKDKLNLGCGRDIKEGWTNIDCVTRFNPEVVHDLNITPYPFEDNTFDEVLMKHLIEHLSEPKRTLNEIHRICKNGAIVQINTPHFSSNNAWSDIEHIRPYTLNTFLNYCEFHGGFKVVKQKVTFSYIKFFMRPLVYFFPFFYEKHLAYIFTGVDLRVTLEVVK